MAEKVKLPVFDMQFTEAVCNVLAQTERPGLSTSELESALLPTKLTVLEDGPNKRTRLYYTLNNAQVRRRRLRIRSSSKASVSSNRNLPDGA